VGYHLFQCTLGNKMKTCSYHASSLIFDEPRRRDKNIMRSLYRLTRDNHHILLFQLMKSPYASKWDKKFFERQVCYRTHEQHWETTRTIPLRKQVNSQNVMKRFTFINLAYLVHMYAFVMFLPTDNKKKVR